MGSGHASYGSARAKENVMNREIAELWVKDLRSNPPQTRLKLFDGKGYCCLGRLCLLAGLTPYEEDRRFFFSTNDATLPNKVLKWAGMRDEVGHYKDTSLAEQNDSGKTFAEIADIIEAHVDEL